MPSSEAASLSGVGVSFLGAGNMAESIAAGALSRGLLHPEDICMSHPRRERLDYLRERLGVRTTESNLDAALSGALVVLTIKPQVLARVLAELRGALRTDQLVLSIVAGAPIDALRTGLLHSSIVRAMPNTPAQIGEGITVWTATEETSPERRAQVRALLGGLGREIEVEDEKQVDFATALSGTGPTYVLLVMEALIDAGVHLGFSRRVAEELVQQTVLGTVLFARSTGKHPAELRNMVTSPGGTSAEAIYQMEKGGLRTVLSRAVYAAYERTQVLSQSVRRSVRGPD